VSAFRYPEFSARAPVIGCNPKVTCPGETELSVSGKACAKTELAAAWTKSIVMRCSFSTARTISANARSRRRDQDSPSSSENGMWV
jgi:hypothetical protein